MKRVLIVTLAFCLILVLGTAFLAPPAYASSYPIDGTNPHTTGCDGNASTIYQLTNPAGDVLELRYSHSCATAWARFTCNQSPFCTNFSFYVRRDQDGANERVDMDAPDVMAGGGARLYTMQLNDQGNLTSKACLYEHLSGNTYCTSSY